MVVGALGKLVETCGRAAMNASAARALSTDVKGAATLVAELRPYAIVIPEEVYDFGGAEFDALARDVGAGLVVVPPAIQEGLLVALLMEEAARLG